MKRSIVLTVVVTAIIFAAGAAQAASVRLGPFVGTHGAIGVTLDLALQDKLWFDFRGSYIKHGSDEVTVLMPGLSYRDVIQDKLEWFAGAGLAIMPTRIDSDTPGEDPSSATTPVGGGVNAGVTYRLTDNMLTSGWLEYAYASNDDVRVSYAGLCLSLEFELGAK